MTEQQDQQPDGHEPDGHEPDEQQPGETQPDEQQPEQDEDYPGQPPGTGEEADKADG